MEENSAKLSLLKERLKSRELRKKEVVLAAQVVAREMVEQIKIPEVALSKEMTDSLNSLAITLAALNSRFDGLEASHGNTISAVESAITALSQQMSSKVTAELSDEQVQALQSAVVGAFEKVKDNLKIVNKFTVPEQKQMKLAEEVIIKNLEPMVKRIVDAVPDSISGKVSLSEYSKKDPATKYLNMRLTDGINFIDSVGGSSPGGVRPVSPGGGGTGGGDASAANQLIIIDDLDALTTILAGIESNTATVPTTPILRTKIEEASDTITYIGKAALTGAAIATSAAVWQIKKIDTSSGTDITMADGDEAFDNVWDNRASLTYN